MNSSSTPPPARIIHVGALARARLVPGRRGRVLAAFSGATYLLTDEAELFWIVAAGAPLHRRALRVSSPLSRPRDGSPFRVNSQSLTIGSGLAYDLRGAFLWQVPETDRRRLLEIPRILPRVLDLLSRLDLSAAKGFGSFIPEILRLSRGAAMSTAHESEDPVLTFARPLVLEVASACLENQPPLILSNAAGLFGLGLGLTPSGDDFAGGVLFAIRTIQDVYRLPGLSDDLFNLDRYQAQTHPISFTLLQDLARGHAVSSLHGLLLGILCAEPFDFVQRSFARLTRLGSSTGWDLLAGLVTGMLVTHADGHPSSASQGLHSVRT